MLSLNINLSVSQSPIKPCIVILLLAASLVFHLVLLPRLVSSEELGLSHYSLIVINMTPQGFQSRSKLASSFCLQRVAFD